MTTEQPDAQPDGQAEEPQWLTPAERRAWLTLGALTIKLPAALDAQLQRDSGLSYYEYMVLAIVSEQHACTMRMSELAKVTNGSLSRLSHVVQRLEKQGLVRREPDARDGRYTNAILTDAGMDKIVAAAPGHVRHVRELVLTPLGSDGLRQLDELGRRVIERLRRDPGCRGSR